METGSEYLVRKIIENHWDEYPAHNSEKKPNRIFQPKIPIHKLLEYKENAFNIDYEIIKAVHDAGRRGIDLSEFLTKEI